MKTNYILILLSFLFITTANAQHKKQYTNFADTTFRIDEVIVSTKQQKKPEVFKLDVPAKFVPISTNQIPSKLLEERGIRDIQQAARFLPGVRIRTTYGGFQQISIRGFDNSVIMIDGVRDERSSIDNSYPFPDLSSIESIELLKGPASVLYGQSAVGGIINIVRKAPKPEQSVNARISYGSYDNKQATMGMGGKLFSTMNYYANFNYADQDGWRDNRSKRFSGYLAIGGKIGKNGNLDLRGGFNRDFYATEIGLPKTMSNNVFNLDGSPYLQEGEMLPNLDKKARYNNESDFLKNHAWNMSAQYTHNFSRALKLTDKLSYSYDDINYFGTEGLSYLESEEPIYKHYYIKNNKKQYICLDTVQLNSPLRFSHIAKTVNNQIELSGRFYTGSITHNYLGGYSLVALFRNSFKGYNLGTDVQGPGLYSKVPVNNPHSMGYMTSSFSQVNVTRTYTHGVYLQDLIEFNDKFKMLLAGRYDHFNYQQVANAPTINGERKFNMPADDEFNKVKSAAFTYRAGLVYLPISSISIYASIGSFFKPYRTFYNQNVTYIDRNGKEFTAEMNGEVFKPEKGYQVEGGVRYALNDKLTANGSFYYIRKYNTVKNLGEDPRDSKKTVQAQVGTMDSKGFDIDLTYTPINDLLLGAGYGYTDARTRDMAKNDFKDSDDLVGKKNTYVPTNTFYGYGDYYISKGLCKGLGFNLSVTFMDEVLRDASTNLKFPSYWLTDIGASYELKNKVKLSVNINNLFNKEYYDQSLGMQLVPSMPRNYQIAISYNL